MEYAHIAWTSHQPHLPIQAFSGRGHQGESQWATKIVCLVPWYLMHGNNSD